MSPPLSLSVNGIILGVHGIQKQNHESKSHYHAICIIFFYFCHSLQSHFWWLWDRNDNNFIKVSRASRLSKKALQNTVILWWSNFNDCIIPFRVRPSSTPVLCLLNKRQTCPCTVGGWWWLSEWLDHCDIFIIIMNRDHIVPRESSQQQNVVNCDYDVLIQKRVLATH